MTHRNFKKEDIQAYVDNMLAPEDAARIKRIITLNPEAKRQYVRLLEQNELLKSWWRRAVN